MLSFIDAIRSGDKKNLESFSPPSSNIDNIVDLNTTVDQFKSSPLLQGGGKDPLFDANTLDADTLIKEKTLKEFNENSPFQGDGKIGQGGEGGVGGNGNLIGSNTPSGNGSGLFAFIPTKPGDAYNFSTITYGIVGAG